MGQGERDWYTGLHAALDHDDRRLVARLKLTASRIEDEKIRQAVSVFDAARQEVPTAKDDEASVRAAARVQGFGVSIIEAVGTRLRSDHL